MPEVTIQAGARLFVPDHADIKRATQQAIEADRELERARGVKVMDLPQTLYGTPAANAITLGISKGQVCGPQQGYAWSVMALLVTGLTEASTPDIVNFYINDRFAGPIWWQLNGNSFGVTFSKLQRVIYPGQTLSLQNSGSIASTSLIQVSGTVIEVPAEQLYKLS